MHASEDDLKKFGWNIQRLIMKEHLSRTECYEMFREVLLDRQPELQQGAFLAALASKGETAREIAGAWEAIVEFDTVHLAEEPELPLVENSGTGMDQLKTFNVSTGASIIAAAGGARLARHGSRALTSACGTVDLVEAMGVDVECSPETVVRSIRHAGIGLFNGMSPKVHPRSLFRILRQIRFGSTLNIAASLASPCRPTHALRGVYSQDLVPIVSEIMQEIGYRKGMVVHGFDSRKEKGLDELSNMGETVIHEFSDGGDRITYSLAPEDVGLKRADYASVAATGNLEHESIRFMKVISGSGHPECIDLACLNAGAIFYLAGHAPSIQSGVDMGRQIVHSGQALQKLCEWVSTQQEMAGRGIEKFVNLAERSGVKSQVVSHLQGLS